MPSPSRTFSIQILGMSALLAGAWGANLSAQTHPATAPAAAGGPATTPAIRAPAMRAALDLSSLSGALDHFLIDNARFPTTAEGLQALVRCPAGLQKTWKGPYTQKPLVDPWGHNYLYVFPSPKNKDVFDLSSAGPDGNPNTPDDIPAP